MAQLAEQLADGLGAPSLASIPTTIYQPPQLAEGAEQDLSMVEWAMGASHHLSISASERHLAQREALRLP